MRRKDREVTDISQILEIIDKCKVMHLAMIDEGKPYIVPLNFGYTYKDDKLEIYFHSALEGRKKEILAANPLVCFEMDCSHQLVPNEIACKNKFLYESVIGEGAARLVSEPEEKARLLDEIMLHQSGKKFGITANITGGVLIYKIVTSSFCGKAFKRQ